MSSSLWVTGISRVTAVSTEILASPAFRCSLFHWLNVMKRMSSLCIWCQSSIWKGGFVFLRGNAAIVSMECWKLLIKYITIDTIEWATITGYIWSLVVSNLYTVSVHCRTSVKVDVSQYAEDFLNVVIDWWYDQMTDYFNHDKSRLQRGPQRERNP